MNVMFISYHRFFDDKIPDTSFDKIVNLGIRSVMWVCIIPIRCRHTSDPHIPSQLRSALRDGVMFEETLACLLHFDNDIVWARWGRSILSK